MRQTQILTQCRKCINETICQILSLSLHANSTGVQVKWPFLSSSLFHTQWVQSKRHRLWFSTKTVKLLLNENSCKQHDPHSLIECDFVEKHYMHEKWSSLSTTHILMYMFLNKVMYSIWGLGSRYLYEFLLSNNYMSSLRTTTCDALIVPSYTWTEAFMISVIDKYFVRNGARFW